MRDHKSPLMQVDGREPQSIITGPMIRDVVNNVKRWRTANWRALAMNRRTTLRRNRHAGSYLDKRKTRKRSRKRENTQEKMDADARNIVELPYKS